MISTWAGRFRAAATWEAEGGWWKVSLGPAPSHDLPARQAVTVRARSARTPTWPAPTARPPAALAKAEPA